jgi:two-component system, OmpR family, sensor kinase
MLRSLRVRLVVFFAVPVLVAGALALVLTTRSVTEYERAATEATLREQGPGVVRQFAEAARRAFETDGEPGQINIRTFVRQITGADILFVPNPDYAEPYPGGNVETWPGLDLDWARLARGEQLVFEATPPARDPSLVVVSGVFLTRNYRPDPDGAIAAFGAILLTRPLATLAPGQSFWARRLVPAFLAAGAASLILALLFGLRITTPLRRLAAASAAIAKGRYDAVRLDRRRGDEIGQLNRAFGDMASQLAEAREHERLFLMRVSHELRTPLTAIQGHVGALGDGVAETPEEQAEAYAVIAAEATRLERLIRDLLDLAKLEARRFTLERSTVDVAELVNQCHAARLPTAPDGVELVLGTVEAGIVIGDPDRIQQVIANLVDNAIRWAPPGGVARLSAPSTATRVVIEVADSGPGIAPERRADVLRPFFSEDVRGTGLGLAIAAELTLAMGGSLTVGDAPEGGALFTCSLPRIA